jgi:hypothetical protein
MKNFTRVAFLLLLFWRTDALAQTNPEEITIRQVIEAETASYANESQAATAQKFWILDEKTLKVVSILKDKMVVTVTAAEMLAATEAPAPSQAWIERSDFIFQINGDGAVVYQSQKIFVPEMGLVHYTREVRFMEKVQGAWKIHLMTVHFYKTEAMPK